MATPRMNDPIWVASLLRAKASTKYEFVAIHVLAPFRNHEGVAPVVLQTRDGYWRAPAYMEAMFELCLRHLHRSDIPWPDQGHLTPQAVLTNRAMEALRLPGRYLPTVEGKVIDMEPTLSRDKDEPNQDAKALLADQSDTEQSTETPAESVDDLDVAALPNAEAEQCVEPPPACEDQASTMNQGQLAAPLALSDTESEPIAGEVLGSTEVDTAFVAERPSTLSKKARRRAAQKARRRGA